MSVRILHTSDWHLGKKLFKEERKIEHEQFLKWLEDFIKSEKIDMLLIAGDVFDSPSPPHDSLELFNNFLFSLAEKNIKVFIIAGNHDSATLLEAPKRFYKAKEIEVVGNLKKTPHAHLHFFDLNNEKFLIHSLPYFRNFEIYEWLKEQDLKEREDSIVNALEYFFEIPKEYKMPRILISHHLYGSFIESGSEQSLNLSGIDSIPIKLLEGKYDYVALGHIHKPQIIKNENPHIAYSGSPIPMRFSESENKIVKVLEIKDGKISHRTVQIPIFRKIMRLTLNFLTFEEELKNLKRESGLEPYVETEIALKEPVHGIVDRIRELLFDKNMKLLSFYPNYEKVSETNLAINLDRKKINEMSPVDLFELYYKEKYETPQGELPRELREDFLNLLRKVEDKPNEA